MPIAEPVSVRFERAYMPEPNSGCWLWLQFLTSDGYGSIRSGNRMHPAHRVAYELYRGEIPVGLVIDHLCRNRCCVNPWHLEVVTRRENTLRGNGPSAQQAKRKTCALGHELIPVGFRRERRCRECVNAASRRYQQRERAKRSAATQQVRP